MFEWPHRPSTRSGSQNKTHSSHRWKHQNHCPRKSRHATATPYGPRHRIIPAKLRWFASASLCSSSHHDTCTRHNDIGEHRTKGRRETILYTIYTICRLSSREQIRLRTALCFSAARICANGSWMNAEPPCARLMCGVGSGWYIKKTIWQVEFVLYK